MTAARRAPSTLAPCRQQATKRNAGQKRCAGVTLSMDARAAARFNSASRSGPDATCAVVVFTRDGSGRVGAAVHADFGARSRCRRGRGVAVQTRPSRAHGGGRRRALARLAARCAQALSSPDRFHERAFEHPRVGGDEREAAAGEHLATMTCTSQAGRGFWRGRGLWSQLACVPPRGVLS
jgi:hypothetical protein